MTAVEESRILEKLIGDRLPTAMHRIIELAQTLRSSTDPTLNSLAASLSTRQLLRLAKRFKVCLGFIGYCCCIFVFKNTITIGRNIRHPMHANSSRGPAFLASSPGCLRKLSSKLSKSVKLWRKQNRMALRCDAPSRTECWQSAGPRRHSTTGAIKPKCPTLFFTIRIRFKHFFFLKNNFFF